MYERWSRFKDNLRLSENQEFRHLLIKIAAGGKVLPKDMLPYISQKSRDARLWTNFKLAEAFFAAGDHDQAKVCITRVWINSGQDEKYLQLYIRIHAACDDILAIREAHKALGIRKANAKNISDALSHFNDWQYAFVDHRKKDDYRYDLEILERIAALASSHTCTRRVVNRIETRRLRLAYLLFGITHANSVIVEIAQLFARYHDAKNYEVTFFIPEQAASILIRPEALDHVKAIKNCGWNVIHAPIALSEEKSLIALSRAIDEFQPDILITTAGLADFRHYFIAMLRPAPLIVGLCQGPPPQYIAPSFDWSISWFEVLVPDCPTDCSVVKLRLDLPVRTLPREVVKASFTIPPDSPVFMVSGRPEKLQDIGFLRALAELLISHPNAYFVVVGISELPDKLLDLFTQDVRERILVLGWQKDFIKVLSMADIVVDTYPSGGGVVVKYAMALGTPVLSFTHDWTKTFNQTECSAAEEIIAIPELIIDRGDFSSLGEAVSRLLADRPYWIRMAKLCESTVQETSGQPEKMVKECEQIYLDLVNGAAKAM